MSAEEAIRAVAQRYDGDAGEAMQLAEDALRRLDWRARRGRKECATCHEDKPVAAFTLDSSRADGLTPQCRECRSRIRARRQG